MNVIKLVLAILAVYRGYMYFVDSW